MTVISLIRRVPLAASGSARKILRGGSEGRPSEIQFWSPHSSAKERLDATLVGEAGKPSDREYRPPGSTGNSLVMWSIASPASICCPLLPRCQNGPAHGDGAVRYEPYLALP